MIAIINVGELGEQKHKHLCRYKIVIGDEFIAEFEHFREDGLSKCLSRASDAVDRAAAKREQEALDHT